MRLIHGTSNIIPQLHAIKMQLHFKDDSFHIAIAPSVDRHKLHVVRIRLSAHESHFNFEGKVSIASDELLAGNVWIKSVSNAHDLHNMARASCVRPRVTCAKLNDSRATHRTLLKEVQKKLNVRERLENNGSAHKVC